MIGIPARAWARNGRLAPTVAARSATIRLARLPVSSRLPAKVESSASPSSASRDGWGHEAAGAGCPGHVADGVGRGERERSQTGSRSGRRPWS